MAHLAGARTPTNIPIEDAELLLNRFNTPPQPTPRHIGDWIESVDGEMMDAAAVLLSARLLELQKRRYLNSRGGSPATTPSTPNAAWVVPATLTTATAWPHHGRFPAYLPAIAAEDINFGNTASQQQQNAQDLTTRETAAAARHEASEAAYSQSESGADSSDSSSDSDLDETNKPATNTTSSAESSRATTPFRPSTPIFSKHPGFKNTSSISEYFASGSNKTQYHYDEPSTPVRPFRLSRLKRSRYESSEDEAPQQLHSPRKPRSTGTTPVKTPRVKLTVSSPAAKRPRKAEPSQSSSSSYKPQTSSPPGTGGSSSSKKRARSPSPSAAVHRVSSTSPSPEERPAPAPSSKRRKPARAQAERVCSYCSTTTTPMWRHGPEGYNDLCNRCGVKYLRRRILQGNEE
ncbi:hypothetical protein HDU87_006346 [Geranomyces variabilis]|uniref:GATA-type domain-containing protein n=1 Tax=Geranomyces variabilis TaxID=109894 RepID=A0AAD5XQL6_9FUNG|nr:hypothetical protein HDU87_006346 [Geranomyces variabilis]